MRALGFGLLFGVACCRLAAGPDAPPKPRVLDGTDIHFAHISPAQGLSQNRVGQIVQDDQGFIWLGTQDGLKRFDGYRFREYRHDPDSANSLSGSSIRDLFKDRSGRLWVGADLYLDSYNPATDTFTRHRFSTSEFDGPVTQIMQDRAGTIWVSTNHGLTRLDPPQWRASGYRHRSGDPASIRSDLVRGTFEDGSGTLWVATAEGLDRFDKSTGTVTRHLSIPLPAGETPGRTRFCEDHAGVLWMAMAANIGLAIVDRASDRVIPYPLDAAGPLAGIEAIYEDADGALWLGTVAGGLLRLDRDRRTVVRYRESGEVDSPHSNHVAAIFEDRQGNMWLGTTGGGVDRFVRKPIPFRRYRDVSGNQLTSSYEDSRGVLWVGSHDGLKVIDWRTPGSSFQPPPGGAAALAHTYVLSTIEDSSGDLWFATFGSGLYRLDRRTQKIQVYRHNPRDPRSLSHDVVTGLTIDRHGTLWVGTENGVNAFDSKTGQFRCFGGGNQEFSRIHIIAEDAGGALWLGTWHSGILRLDPSTGSITSYRRSDAGGTLSSDLVNTLFVDRSGRLWVGTPGGLNQFHSDKGSFSTYTERDGLPNNNVNGILEDREGMLWLSTSNGLARFDPRAATFQNYYTTDGIFGNEFDGFSVAFQSREGQMFFCSYNGLTAFFPDQVQESPAPLRVVFTDFQLMGKPVPIGRNSPLKRPVAHTTSLTLGHSQRIFSFEFSALSYTDPERVLYRYRLEGLESAWNFRDADHRSVTYTTLSPRRYVLHVQARTPRGPWSEADTRMAIEILPPWWSTWWFRGVCVVLILLAVATAHYVRVHAIERRNRELALEVAQRTAAESEIKALTERLINAQEQERTRIARELHDDLNQQIAAVNLSLGGIRLGLGEREKEATTQLENLHQHLGKLSQSVRAISHELHPAILEYGDLADALRAHCAEFSSINGIDISFDASGQFEGLDPAVALCIYRVTQEALQNAAKHSSAKQVTVHLERTAGGLRLTVSDRGVGFRLDQARASGGLGLVSIKERVRLVKGVIELETQPHQGTTLHVAVPLAESGSD